MMHNQVAFDLLHGVEGHTDTDQDGSASHEMSKVHRDLKPHADKGRDDGHKSSNGNPRHNFETKVADL